MNRGIVGAAAALIALALAPAAITEAGAPRVKKTVEIRDNFFAPDSLRVPRRSVITWKWPSLPAGLHDVKLARGPKGVERFHSELASSDSRFKRTLRKPGKYTIVCTLHAEMRMTVRVRRR